MLILLFREEMGVNASHLTLGSGCPQLAAYAPFDASGDNLASGLPTTLYLYDAANKLMKVLNPNGTETDDANNPVADTQSTTDKLTSSGAILEVV